MRRGEVCPRLRLALAAGICLLAIPAVAAAQAAATAGLQYESPDGRFQIRPKARFFLDGVSTSGSDDPARNVSDHDIRTLYFGVEGAVDRLTFTLVADFAGDEPALRSAYLSWSEPTPAGEVEIILGNRLTERGLEGSSSSEGLPFIERNAVAGALAPQKGLYGMGLTAKLFADTWHVAGQVAGDDINRPELTEGAVTTTVRGHWNPVSTREGVLHLGAWGYQEDFTSDLTRLSRTTNWVSPVNDRIQVTLGTLADPRRTRGLGGEIGAVRGPTWAFLEFGERRIETAALAADVQAWALSAGWVLTGEPATYSPRAGTFVRRSPAAPLSRGGLGGLEVTCRVQRLDNSDAPFGGTGQDLTVGLNWRMESWARLMVNASHWKVESRAATGPRQDAGDAILARLQIAF